jgi:hypothetical protein
MDKCGLFLIERKIMKELTKSIKAKLERENFYGTVLLKDWFRHIDGRNYCGVTGTVSVFSDIEATGFESKGGHNWMAHVTGSDDTQITILGCQIKAFTKHGNTPFIIDQDFWYSNKND